MMTCPAAVEHQALRASSASLTWLSGSNCSTSTQSAYMYNLHILTTRCGDEAQSLHTIACHPAHEWTAWHSVLTWLL